MNSTVSNLFYFLRVFCSFFIVDSCILKEYSVLSRLNELDESVKLSIMYQESLSFLFYIFGAHIFLLIIDYILKVTKKSYSSFEFIQFFSPYFLFQWRSFTAYTLFLRNLGIGIRPLVITWYTSIFNRVIQKIGSWRSKFQSTWFVCGTWITLFALPFALYFVIQSTLVLLVSVISKGDKSVKTVAPYLEPAVRSQVYKILLPKCFSVTVTASIYLQLPGVNIPISDTGYYISTLLICSVFHELGHATAAVR